MVFAQQLGRGLRTQDGKSHLTVLDLIGQQRREFRMDRRLGVLLDRRRGPISHQVEDGFPFLPAGCSIVLEQKARETVLRLLRALARDGTKQRLVADLREARDDGDLAWFLRSTDREAADFYRSADVSWTSIRRAAGRKTAPVVGDPKVEASLLRSCGVFSMWMTRSATRATENGWRGMPRRHSTL